MTRVVLGDRHYPAYAPKIVWHRVKHWLFGPLLGCSCSGPGTDPRTGKRLGRPSLLAGPSGGCFYSKWRIEYPARDRYRDRVRIAELERKVRELEKGSGHASHRTAV